jgi:hypothetical protein
MGICTIAPTPPTHMPPRGIFVVYGFLNIMRIIKIVKSQTLTKALKYWYVTLFPEI